MGAAESQPEQPTVGSDDSVRSVATAHRCASTFRAHFTSPLPVNSSY